MGDAIAIVLGFAFSLFVIGWFTLFPTIGVFLAVWLAVMITPLFSREARPSLHPIPVGCHSERGSDLLLR